LYQASTNRDGLTTGVKIMTTEFTTGIEDYMTVVCYTYHEAVTYAVVMLGVDRSSIYKRMQGHSIGFSPLVGDVRFYREDKGTWSVRLKSPVIETAPVVIVEPVIEAESVVAEDADEGDLHYVPQDLGEGVSGVPADTTTPMIEDAMIEDAPVMKAYRGGLSYDTFENGEQYLCDHCLTRAADGSVLYISFGTAHRVLEVFASVGGDYLTYESSPFEGAWDIYGEWLSDSEADPAGYAKYEAYWEARNAAWLEAVQNQVIEWDKESGDEGESESLFVKLTGIKLNDE